MSWTRLSRSRFVPNRVRLSPFILACNPADSLRRFALPKEASSRSPRGARLEPVKIGAGVISHARSAVFRLAEAAVSEASFTKMPARVHGPGYAPG